MRETANRPNESEVRKAPKMSDDPAHAAANPAPDTNSSRAVGKKRPYSPPVLLEWGSLDDLTQANGNSGNRDGGRRPFTRTR